MQVDRNTVRFIPPLLVSSKQVDKGVELFEQALKAAEKRVKA